MKGLNQREEGGLIVAPGHLGHFRTCTLAPGGSGRRPTDLVFERVRAGGAWAETPGF